MTLHANSDYRTLDYKALVKHGRCTWESIGKWSDERREAKDNKASQGKKMSRPSRSNAMNATQGETKKAIEAEALAP